MVETGKKMYIFKPVSASGTVRYGIYARVVDVSEIERVRFLIQKQRVRKCRTKHFPCGIVFIIYILRHSSFCQPFISNLSKILKCQNMPLHSAK